MDAETVAFQIAEMAKILTNLELQSNIDFQVQQLFFLFFLSLLFLWLGPEAIPTLCSLLTSKNNIYNLNIFPF